MSDRATRSVLAQLRFDVYLDAIAAVLGRAGRAAPVRAYCRGLLLPGERKNIELVAARLGSDRVRARHQSLHHVVTKAGWDDAAMLAAVRRRVFPAIEPGGTARYFFVNDIVLPKQGIHSVGVAKQSPGSAIEPVNCQVAVSLWAGSELASLPIAYRLFLPPAWASDPRRREAAGVPPDVGFESKATIALRHLRQACADGVRGSVVLADAGYGDEAEFRFGLEALGLRYMLDVSPAIELWPFEATGPAVAMPDNKHDRGSRRRPTPRHGPVSAQALAAALPIRAWRTIKLRDGGRAGLSTRFAAMRVDVRFADFGRISGEDKWLLIEWAAGKTQPERFWLSDLPANAALRSLAWTAKSVWRIVTDCKELKQNIGLAHFEGRGWRGHHHHASLCIAVYGFLVSERCCFPPAQRYIPGKAEMPALSGFRPHGSNDAGFPTN